MNWPEQPDDWAQLEWHPEPRGLAYKSEGHARRAARWLNTHEGIHEVWEFKAVLRVTDGRWTLYRRWQGVTWGLLGPPPTRREQR